MHGFFERGLEARDEIVRQITHEADGVREQHLGAALEFPGARLGIERREQLVIRVRPRGRERVEQRAFAGVRVADDADGEVLAVALLDEPALARLDFLDLALQLADALADDTAVDFELLFARAARLVKVDYVEPPSVIGKTTVAGLQSGLVYGFAGQVDGIVTAIRGELEAPDAPVVATGGLAELVAPHSSTIAQVDPFLTLEGLRLVWDLNR